MSISPLAQYLASARPPTAKVFAQNVNLPPSWDVHQYHRHTTLIKGPTYSVSAPQNEIDRHHYLSISFGMPRHSVDISCECVAANLPTSYQVIH
jgi:hypothetical protein